MQRGLGGPLPNFTALSPTQLHGLTQQVSPGFQQQHQMFRHQHTAELPSQGEQSASIRHQEQILPNSRVVINGSCTCLAELFCLGLHFSKRRPLPALTSSAPVLSPSWLCMHDAATALQEVGQRMHCTCTKVVGLLVAADGADRVLTKWE